MQQSTLISLIVLCFAVAIILAIFWYAWRRPAVCPHCKSARVAKQTTCPFCGKPYHVAISQPLPRVESVLFTPTVPEPPPVPDPQGPRLVCLEGTTVGQEYPIKPTGETLGRSSENSICLDGILVSRSHAQILVRDGQYVLRDLNSTNGTYVNGVRVYEQPLQRGDLIQIGKVKFVFQIGAAVEPLAHPSPYPAPSISAPAVADMAQGLKSYQITGKIGSGGAATVFKGVSLINQAQVAIKILHSVDPYIKRKFKEEGTIGLRLKHPHIIQVYQSGEEAGAYYIVMEYADAGSLRQCLNPHVPAPLEFIQSIIGQTCEALAYSHQHGVIHRDIKPENIMLSTRAGVKVGDFGIAKLTTTTTTTLEGKLMGTPYYVPYEQAAGDEVTPASDIYSLGVVLYEMLTGEWPFTGAPLEVIEKHLTQKPLPPRRINPNITPELETVVMRALEKDIRKRYQNAMDLARDLGYRPDAAISVPQFNGLMTIPPLEGDLGKSIVPRLPQAPNAGVPYLVVIGGGADGKRLPLDQPILSLRRMNVDPNDVLISRDRHCRIFQQAGQFWLEDEKSTNGTFLNGQRLQSPTLLKPGDVIQVGNAQLRFVA